MEIDFSAANNLPPRADEFFRIFARFEFSLKMAGYCELKGKKVEIKWDDFSKSGKIGAGFLKLANENNICPEILKKPPKTETIIDGQYGFKSEVAPINSVQDLFGAVRRVRNNLFHGGKYFDDDHQRNEKLVAEAMNIILLALNNDETMKYYFEGRA